MKLHILVLLAFFGSFLGSTTTKYTKIESSFSDTLYLKTLVPFEQETSDRIDAYFTHIYKAGLFNGSVILYNDGQVFWKTYGVRDWRTNDSLSLNTPFQLASVSKTITSAAVMLLVERGEIKLSDTLKYFFPDMPYSGVTVEHLLSHRSGLGDYLNFLRSGWKSSDPITNEQLVGFMIEKKPAMYNKPGRVFYYNNTNYAILAAIVEKVTSEPFEDFVDREIFEPLGMYNSFIFRNGYNERTENAAIGFSGKYARNDKFTDGVVGDKGAYASALDLLKFHVALQNNTLLSDSTQHKMYAGYPEMQGIKDYGLGWRLFKDGSGIVYHRGWWNGFKNNFLRIPRKNACVIVLSNNDKSQKMDMALMFRLMGINISEREFDF